MSDKLCIHHPKNGCTIATYTFVAWGLAPWDMIRVKGVLIDQSTNPPTVTVGKTTRHPPRWSVLFRDVTGSGTGKPYIFQLIDVTDAPVEVPLISVNVKVTGPGYGPPTIVEPAKGAPAQCGSNFSSYGTSDSTETIQGNMASSNATVNGNVVFQPVAPEYCWAMTFPPLSAGDYTLTVSKTDGKGQSTVGVTINDC
jgi:hypothetical protein